MTLIHGAGVHCPSPRIVTYSRPPAAKPPRPLKNSSFGGGAAGSGIRSRRPASWRRRDGGLRIPPDV